MERAWRVDGPSIFCFYQALKTRWEKCVWTRDIFSNVHENRLEKQQYHVFFVIKSHQNASFRCPRLRIFIEMPKKCLACKRIFSASFRSMTKTKYTRIIYSSSSLRFWYLFHHSLRYFFSKIAKKMSIIILL